jgi:hypothetical protein
MHEVFLRAMRVQGESNPPDHIQKLSVDDGEFSENILHCGSILYVYYLMLGVTLREISLSLPSTVFG